GSSATGASQWPCSTRLPDSPGVTDPPSRRSPHADVTDVVCNPTHIGGTICLHRLDLSGSVRRVVGGQLWRSLLVESLSTRSARFMPPPRFSRWTTTSVVYWRPSCCYPARRPSPT